MLKNITTLFLALFFVTNQFVAGQTAPIAPPSNGLPSRVPPSFSLPNTAPSTSSSSTDHSINPPGSGLPATNPQPPTAPTAPTPPVNFPSNTLPPGANTLPSNPSPPSSTIPPTSKLPTTNPQPPTAPTAPTPPVNFPSDTHPSGSHTIPPPPLPNTSVWLNPHDNNVLPIEVECDIARLLVLQDNPIVAADGSTPFAVIAQVYAGLLNLFATDDAPQKIMYTDNIKPFIDQHLDSNGNYSYTPVLGKENTLLGYSSCLSATAFRDQLCKDQNTFFMLDGNVDSNQQTYFWVHFSTTFLTTEDGSDNGLTHYQWINHTGIGNYYDFYFTKDHPDLSHMIPNSSDICVRSLTANVWVGTRDDTNSTHDWTVTGNKSTGLLTSSDGSPFTKVAAPDNPSPSQETPTQPPANSSAPAAKNLDAWDDFLEHGAGSAWEAYLNQNASKTQSSSSN